MAKVLILYSTTDGHTVEICRRITKTLEQGGDNAEILDLMETPSLDGRSFEKIGTSNIG